MQRLRIEHLTEYDFGTPVTVLPHRLMLRPRVNHNVRIASSELHIEPAPTLRWQRDALDNSVALATFSAPSASLRIASTVVIEHYEEAPLDFVVEDYAVKHPFAYLDDEARVLAPYRMLSWPDDEHALRQWLGSLGLGAHPEETYVLLDRLNHAIHDGFRYEAREAEGVQSPALTLSLGTGSCRDFAALFMDACRALGLASRFVSGYSHVPASTGDPGSTHAWAETYLPGPGWKGFDPTAGELVGTRHIPVAVAHHPQDVPPVAGSFVGPANLQPSLLVRVSVEPYAAEA